MALPTFEEILIPILRIAKENGDSTNIMGIQNRIFDIFDSISESEKQLQYVDIGNFISELLKIGRDHLLAAKLLVGDKTSFKISSQGKKVLAKNYFIDKSFLMQYSTYESYLEEINNKTIKKGNIEQIESFWQDRILDFVHKYNSKKKEKGIEFFQSLFRGQPAIKNNIHPKAEIEEITIDERIYELHKTHEAAIKKELLEKLKSLSPAAFEKIVAKIILKFVYDGKDIPDDKNNIINTGGKNDKGIDGIVIHKGGKHSPEKRYYFQAKRYDYGSVGSDAIRNFVGSLVLHGINDGIIVTSSKFTVDAEKTIKDYDEKGIYKIKPIKGEELVEMMLDYQIAIKIIHTLPIMEINYDLFETYRKH